jgi:hypothetical protein
MERTWEEALGSNIKVLSRNLPGGTEGIHKRLMEDNLCPGKNSDWTPHEYMSETLRLSQVAMHFHE